MFFTYLYRELRRRHRQAILTSLGLALGICLVVVVTAASSGVSDAQTQVLHSLYGVGTDISVTKVATAGNNGHFQFGLNPGSTSRQGKKFSRSNVFSSSGHRHTLHRQSHDHKQSRWSRCGSRRTLAFVD